MSKVTKRKSLIFNMVAAIILLMSVFATSAPINAIASGIAPNDPVEDALYHGDNVDNVAPFLEFLSDSGFDIEDDNALSELMLNQQNFAQLYNYLIDKKIIEYIPNDYLHNFLPKVSLDWSGGDDTNPNETPSTHRSLTQKAVERLYSINTDFFGASASENYNTISLYSDYPDRVGENDVWPQDVHFYYPSTGTNLDGKADTFNSSGGINTLADAKTAKGRFIYYYNQAKAKCLAGDLSGAKVDLGKSVHYLADLATPVHTGYTGVAFALGVLSGHMAFENGAKNYHDLAGYTPSYTHRNFHNYASLGAIADEVASVSNSFFQQYFDFNWIYVYYNAPMEISLQESASSIATVMYRFALETGLAENGAIIQNNVVTGYNPYLPSTTQSLIIPHGVTAIGAYALANAQISQISIPTSISTIGYYAFANCTGLTAITLPAEVTYVDSYAFSGCNNLTITLQRASVPITWSSTWNSGRPVVFTVPGGCGLTHVTKYEKYSNDYHKLLCINCNDYVLIKHNVYYEKISIIQHWKRCTACTLEVRENHIMIGSAFACCPMEYLSAHQEHLALYK